MAAFVAPAVPSRLLDYDVARSRATGRRSGYCSHRSLKARDDRRRNLLPFSHWICTAERAKPFLINDRIAHSRRGDAATTVQGMTELIRMLSGTTLMWILSSVTSLADHQRLTGERVGPESGEEECGLGDILERGELAIDRLTFLITFRSEMRSSLGAFVPGEWMRRSGPCPGDG
jgi:hypothetical protein